MDADLVLEGGGVKGIGLVGAYSALTDAGYTFHRIAGTSAGAIVGSLIAAGMGPEDLKDIMRTVDYGRFQDESFIDHLGLVGKGFSVLFEKGIYEGHYHTPWIPAMSKALARRYVSLLGRDPAYVDTLTFLSPGMVRRILAKVPELRLVHPLEEGCADFLPLRIQAYLDAAGSHERQGASLHVVRALHWLSARPAFKSVMKRFASVTGVYHEMHLTGTKR